MGGTAIAEAYHHPARVAAAINNLAVADRAAVVAAYLQAIHQEIALKKLAAFLERAPLTAAGDLLDRPAHAATDKLVWADANEYREYLTFIRGLNAKYSTAKLNDFVVEMANNAKDTLTAKVET